MKRRNEPCFWVEDECSFCGNRSTVYTPDLLSGPIEKECPRCHHKWGFAPKDGDTSKIEKLLQLARRQDDLWDEIGINRIKLGYC